MRPCRSKTCQSDYYEENEDRYYEERNDAFNTHIQDQIEAYIAITDMPSVDNFSEFLEDNFTFPEIEDWMASEFEGMIGEYEDQKYEEYKDRQMGIV